MARELGRLIGQMIDILKARRGEKMGDVLNYLADVLSVEPDTIYKWRQGRHKPDADRLAHLVEIGVSEARMDHIWGKRVLRLGEHPQGVAILNRLFPAIDSPKVRHNLPRRPYMRLIGRDSELIEIVKRLAPESRHWLIPVEGVGGVGKSALALEIGWRFIVGYDQIPLGRRFDAIVWASAKREALTSRGAETLLQSLTNLDDVYSAIAEVLESQAILQASSTEKHREVARALRQAGQVLLILDNLETVDDPQVLTFLRDLPQPIKAVVTMRFHEDMPYPIRLRELDRESAKELIVQESLARDLELQNDQIERLLDYTKGLPLAMWWAIGVMAVEGYSAKAMLERLSDPNSDLLRFMFDEVIQRMRGTQLEAYKTLLAVSFFDLDAGAALAPLAATAGLDLETTLTALHHLLNSNLANRTDTVGRFSILPLTRSYAQAEVKKEHTWHQEARERWVSWYLNYVQEHPKLANYASLEQEALNVINVMEWLLLNDHMSELASVFDQVRDYLYSAGHWDLLLNVANQVIMWAESVNKPELISRSLLTLENILHKRGDYDEAQKLLERAKTSAANSDNEIVLAEVLLAQGRRRRRGSLVHYVETLTRALEIFQNRNHHVGIVSALNSLGNVFLRDKRYEEAQAYYMKGLKVLEQNSEEVPTVSRWHETFTGNLAIALGRQGNYSHACELLYSILDKLVDQTDVAEAKIILAVWQHKLGNYAASQLLGWEAEHIIEQLGLARPICDEDAEWLLMQEDSVSEETWTDS